MNRGNKIFGLVVTHSDLRGYGKYVNKVFVLEGTTGTPHLFHVLRDAFKLEADNVYYMEGNEFDIAADVKNLSRKREKALEVGDWISWFHTGGDEIFEFKRERKMHEMRCHGEHSQQFLVECVKSPTENALYNRTFGFVKLSAAEGKRIMPEIAFECWVDVYLDENEERLIVEFAEFVTSTYQMQINVVDTPWTEYHKVDVCVSTSKKHNNVFGRRGYYTSFNSLYDKDTPTEHYLLPYVTDDMLPGVQYRFDAFWNEERGVFIVTSAVKIKDGDSLPTISEDDDRFLLVDTVNQRKDVKSLFHTTKNGYGTMDCPTDALALHHLSRYADSKCRVYFYEDLYGSFGRFRIERPDEDKTAKIEKNVRETVPEVSGIRGVVVSSDGRVFSPAHSTVRIFLPSSSRLPVGTQLVCDAKVDVEKKDLEAIEDTVKVLSDEKPLEFFDYNGRLIFSTTVEWTARGDVIRGVVSPHFSLVDDPLRLLPDADKKTANNMSVWVAEAGADVEGKRRVAQTPFFVVAVGAERPNLTEPKFVDKHGRDIAGWVRERDGTLKAMEAPEKKIKPAAGKFTMPKPRRELDDREWRETAVSTPSIPPPSPSVCPPSTVFECGCATGSCRARMALQTLMSDQAFTRLMHTKMPEALLDRVLECIL